MAGQLTATKGSPARLLQSRQWNRRRREHVGLAPNIREHRVTAGQYVRDLRFRKLVNNLQFRNIRRCRHTLFSLKLFARSRLAPSYKAAAVPNREAKANPYVSTS
jgi:hypothetical protein